MSRPELIRALIMRGAADIAHSNTDLLTHLQNTADILRKSGAEEHVCDAALFHSVYGTDTFSPSFTCPWSRKEIQALIGVAAERLVFAYSKVSKNLLLQGKYQIDEGRNMVLVSGHHPGTILRLRRETFSKLEQIARANMEEMRAALGAMTAVGKTFFHSPQRSLSKLIPSSVAMFGIPSDAGSSKRGSALGPDILRDATSKLCFRSKSVATLIDLQTLAYPLLSVDVVDLGDVDVRGKATEIAIKSVFDFASGIPLNVFTFAVGGSHLFTLPLVRARVKSSNVHLVHIDQHADCQVWGDFVPSGPILQPRATHSNFISYLLEELPDLQVTQIGLNRFMSIGPNRSPEHLEKVAEHLRRSTRITDQQIECWKDEELLAALPSQSDVYISLDVDVLAASAMFDTAYPAAAGVSYHRLVHVLELLAQRNRIIGCDLMEFAIPSTSLRSAPARLAADLCARLVAAIMESQSKCQTNCRIKDD